MPESAFLRVPTPVVWILLATTVVLTIAAALSPGLYGVMGGCRDTASCEFALPFYLWFATSISASLTLIFAMAKALARRRGASN